MNTAKSAEVSTPVVLELFTSQSCSSCPAADALLKKIADKNSSILALSFHVNYWDHLNWKDTYSNAESTERQYAYADAMQRNGVFTPQLIVNGKISVNGANEEHVTEAISAARKIPAQFDISIKPQNNQLAVNIKVLANAPASADIWEVRYDKYAKTKVKSGENSGRILESVNNVTSLKKLAGWTPKTAAILITAPYNEDIAIIVQEPNFGRILAAASYNQ